MVNIPFPMLASVLWLKGGAKGRNRTVDTSIFSAVLYQLSYLGVSARFSPGSMACCLGDRYWCVTLRCWCYCTHRFCWLSRGLWSRLVMV
jgi:hypothetical protein